MILFKLRNQSITSNDWSRGETLCYYRNTHLADDRINEIRVPRIIPIWLWNIKTKSIMCISGRTK